MSKIEKVKLENGLTIYLYEDKRRKSTFVDLVTKFGGIHHDFVLNGKKYHIPSGVAHFLEHFLLEHTPYGNLMNLFGKMHLYANGVTSLSKTEFHFSGVVHIEEALATLIDAIHRASFTKEEVEETKKAIYEEIRMGNDNKGGRLFALQNECIFKEIPYRNTIGTKEEMDSIDVDMVNTCYKAFYRPSNECIIIAGNFDKEKMIEKIRECYQKLSFEKGEPSLEKYKEPVEVKEKKGLIFMPTAEKIVSVTYKIDVSTFTPKEKLKLDFYFSYFEKMNVGIVSELYKELNRKGIIVGGISADHMFFENTLILSFEANVKKEDAYINAILNQIKNPILKKDLFMIYQRDSTLEIASRCECLTSMILPFIDNIFTFSYEKEDTVRDIKSYTFEDFKKKIESISFDNYSICKIEKERNS